jgi:hypothetical protein
VRGRLLRALRAAERVGYDRSAQSLDLGQHRQHEVDQGLGHDPVGFLPDPSHDVLYKAGPFKSFTATFRSETPYKHTFNFTWWCDAITPWFVANAVSGTKSRGVGEPPDVDPPEPWGPGCVYCDRYYDVVENDGNRLVMNHSAAKIADGNPVISWPNSQGAQNQRWHFSGLGFDLDIPTFGIWTGTEHLDKAVIVEGANHQLSIKTSAGGVPNGGAWFYLDGSEDAIGPNNDSIMLVNTNGDRRRGTPRPGFPTRLLREG